MTRVLLASASAFGVLSSAVFAGGLQPPIQPLVISQSFAAPASCPVVQPVVSSLQAQGFSRIEVDTGPTQARFTAMQGNQMNVFVYDCVSGALLGQNTGSVSGGFAPGTVMVGADDNNDFVDVADAIEGADDIDASAGAGAELDTGTDVDTGAGAVVDGDAPVSSDGGDVGADAGAGGAVSGDAGAGGSVGGNIGTGGGVDSGY